MMEFRIGKYRIKGCKVSYLAAVFFVVAFLGAALLAGTLIKMSLIPKSVINWDATCDELVTWRFCSTNKALILL